jgi:phage terminase large subunit-like protein
LTVRVDPRWLRNPSDELAVAEGCWFDEAAGRFACDFVETFCRQSKGRWRGQPLRLLDWQRDFIMRLFGWKRADGLRRFRRFYLEVAKKNGKSTMVSALVLLLLLADNEGAPEVYLNACDRDQASIVFEEARRMVEASPELSSRLTCINSKGDRRIVDPEGNGVIVANSSVSASKDGLNPSGTLFDELHRQPGYELWEVFEYAGASREQPLLGAITTAGEAAEGPWYDQREHSDKVNAGEIPDTAHLGVVYRCLETDDLDDPATWRKANPSLGETISADDFARELAEAKRDPKKWGNFRRLRLGIITAEDSKFFAAGAWDACNAPTVATDGAPLWMGLDLASTTDLAALATLTGDSSAGFDVRWDFWLPKDNIVELERRAKVPYRAWAEAGFITVTDGEVIDYQFIRRTIRERAAAGELRKLLADPYNATQLSTELKEQDGLPVEFIRQGFLSLSAPTKELDRLVKARKLRHGGHPVARWMAGNAVAETDAAGNVKLSKKKSRHKIDGLAALVNALAAASADPDAGGSVYEQRGLLIL